MATLKHPNKKTEYGDLVGVWDRHHDDFSAVLKVSNDFSLAIRQATDRDYNLYIRESGNSRLDDRYAGFNATRYRAEKLAVIFHQERIGDIFTNLDYSVETQDKVYIEYPDGERLRIRQVLLDFRQFHANFDCTDQPESLKSWLSDRLTYCSKLCKTIQEYERHLTPSEISWNLS